MDATLHASAAAGAGPEAADAPHNENSSAAILTMMAGQPYNIKFWEPKYLAPLGIVLPAGARHEIEVHQRKVVHRLGEHRRRRLHAAPSARFDRTSTTQRGRPKR